jgi:hypothetical protein
MYRQSFGVLQTTIVECGEFVCLRRPKLSVPYCGTEIVKSAYYEHYLDISESLIE